MTSHALVQTGEPPVQQQAALSIVRTDPLADAVQQFKVTLGLATALVNSGFLPKALNTPEKAVAVILAGRELGIGPMLALRSIHIIEGKPVVAADLQLARFKADGGRAVFPELTAETAVLQLRHPNGDEHTETFTIVDARAAQLLNKDNWKKFPKAMLRSRVITAGLKSIGYEPTCGVYDTDEADHFRPASPATASSTAEVVVEAEVVDADGVPHDLDWALAYKYPLEVGKANHLKPMGELGSIHIESVAAWIEKRQADKGDATWHAETLDAMRTILKARKEGRAAEPKVVIPAVAETTTEPVAAPAPIDTTIKPGTVESALTPNETVSFTEVTKHITALLSHEKVGDDDRAVFKGRMEKATTLGELQKVARDLQDFLDQPF